MVYTYITLAYVFNLYWLFVQINNILEYKTDDDRLNNKLAIYSWERSKLTRIEEQRQ